MWEAVGLIAGWIWDGLTAAAAATVAALSATVSFLWGFAMATYDGLIVVGKELLAGLGKAWDFFQLTYDDVLKPAWDKFYSMFDRVRTWLNDTFGPVIQFLQTVRTQILAFYKTWIKPVLDTIDAARSVLKVLEALHVAWAQKLDNALGDLEARINAPFLFVIGKLNELLNFVNRVMTADGLIQRIAHLRTLARDIDATWSMLLQAKTRPLSGDDQYGITRSSETATPKTVVDDTIAMFEGGDSEGVKPLVEQASQEWADLLGLDASTGATS
jgi:hypothetical protein